ncbi:PDZ domain-containing protein [Arenicella xantha]|nr:PDZ domain-containing protein [Arenicella xantha]
MSTIIFSTMLLLTLSLASIGVSYAGETGGKSQKEREKALESKFWDEKNHTEELKYEISFLAKKLLDMSGEETITVSQEPIRKPFLGICSEVRPGGVELTCVTPGHNAKLAGLQTGDIVAELNGANLVSSKTSEVKERFYQELKVMKAGQVMAFKIYRGSEELDIDVTVGEINQPGYTMTIRRK